MLKAIELFNAALERDARFALAHAGLADCYSLLGWIAFGALAPQEAFPKAKAAALRAIELDPARADAYNALAWSRLVYDWDWPGAQRDFLKAIEIDPEFALAVSWYGLSLALRGRMDEAIAYSKRAQQIDPLALIVDTLAGWVYYFARRYDDSIEQCLKTLELEPGYVRAHLGLGWAYEQQGRYKEAIEQFQQGAALSGNSVRYVSALGHAYALAGRRAEAEAQLRHLLNLSDSGHVPASFIASIYAGLGEHELAFQWLETAYHERSGWLACLAVDPQLDGLRRDPRYIDLVRRVGL